MSQALLKTALCRLADRDRELDLHDATALHMLGLADVSLHAPCLVEPVTAPVESQLEPEIESEATLSGWDAPCRVLPPVPR